MADVIEVIRPEAFHTRHELRTRTGDGRDMVVLSGYAEINGNDLRGKPDGNWTRKDLIFRLGPRWAVGPGVPQPDSVPVVSMTSIMNVKIANNAGWAVDSCRVSHVQDVPPGTLQVELTCRVAVRDTDGYMFRVNYYVTTVGRLD